jgi:hypothetical protein
VRAWNALQRLRLLLSELGKVAIPTGPEDFDAEGEALEHALTKSFLISERGDQKSVFVASPISGRHHQERVQKRLSARSLCFVEGVGSGEGSHSGLSHVRTIQTDDFRRRACSPVSYPDTTTTGSADQLEHGSNSGRARDSVQTLKLSNAA